MNENLCQSCGMPLSNESLLGTNEDGAKNKDYCVYCFKDGKFLTDETVEEMIKSCVPHMVKEGFEEDKAIEMLNNLLPNLKRWAK